MKLIKSPLGLLELFNLKTLGRAPPEFGELVQPVCDVASFYGVDRLLPVNETGAAGALSRVQQSAVSVFPRRYLGLSGSVTLGAAAGTVLSLAVGVQFQGGVVINYGHAFISPTTIGGTYIVSAQFVEPLVLAPGHVLRLDVFGDAGGADHTSSLRYLFHRLDN